MEKFTMGHKIDILCTTVHLTLNIWNKFYLPCSSCLMSYWQFGRAQISDVGLSHCSSVSVHSGWILWLVFQRADLLSFWGCLPISESEAVKLNLYHIWLVHISISETQIRNRLHSTLNQWYCIYYFFYYCCCLWLNKPSLPHPYLSV